MMNRLHIDLLFLVLSLGSTILFLHISASGPTLQTMVPSICRCHLRTTLAVDLPYLAAMAAMSGWLSTWYNH